MSCHSGTSGEQEPWSASTVGGRPSSSASSHNNQLNESPAPPKEHHSNINITSDIDLNAPKNDVNYEALSRSELISRLKQLTSRTTTHQEDGTSLTEKDNVNSPPAKRTSRLSGDGVDAEMQEERDVLGDLRTRAQGESRTPVGSGARPVGASGGQWAKMDDKSTTGGGDSHRRESILVMRLAAKEQEVQEFFSQVEELRSSLGGGLRNCLLDPLVNSMFRKLADELRETKQRLEQSQHELNAWKFTPDSTTGKRLMARCRTLIQENEELGKMVEQGRFAQLSNQLAVQTNQLDEMKHTQSEMDELLVDLDQDMEGLQTTVMYLQQQLAAERAQNARLRESTGENPSAESTENADCEQRTREQMPNNNNGDVEMCDVQPQQQQNDDSGDVQMSDDEADEQVCSSSSKEGESTTTTTVVNGNNNNNTSRSSSPQVTETSSTQLLTEQTMVNNGNISTGSSSGNINNNQSKQSCSSASTDLILSGSNCAIQSNSDNDEDDNSFALSTLQSNGHCINLTVDNAKSGANHYKTTTVVVAEDAATFKQAINNNISSATTTTTCNSTSTASPPSKRTKRAPSRTVKEKRTTVDSMA